MTRRRSLAGILTVAALGAVLLVACEVSEPNKATPVAPTAPVGQPTAVPVPIDTQPATEGSAGYPYPYPAP